MASVVSNRIAGIPTLYLYTGSIIVYGAVILLTNLPAIRAGTSALAQQIAMVAAAGMVVIGIYEVITKSPEEYDVAGPVVGLLVLGASGLLIATLLGFLGVW
ncbi:hypothetical protein [Halococcus sp. IIIV-5B]|uniref:hypothetical protein n=1 Tax=Halococcus sp. IIIV-5B TaxID=2321230 RepID=UPI000E727B35|nr:hypothetical protein [Halococcus sp. IIIV-5B]RJT07430.1 hypothetical protein D3261_02115 [Halococcus sp. IIIV-5B]